MKTESLIDDPGHVIAYYPDLASFLGSVNAAILLCQLIYWHGKGWDQQGWIRKASKELQLETALTKDKQESARRILRDMGLVEENHRGTPPVLHFRICVDNLRQKWRDHRLKYGESPQLKRRKTAVRKVDNTVQHTAVSPPRISESTSETTQNNTSESDEIRRERGLKHGRKQSGYFEPIAEILSDRFRRSV